MMRWLHAFDRRIAVKLTLTLVGFVVIALFAGSLYLNRALEAFAIENLEARLTTAAGLLSDDARRLLRDHANLDRVHAFAVNAARPSGARVTLIAPDGVVRGD